MFIKDDVKIDPLSWIEWSLDSSGRPDTMVMTQPAYATEEQLARMGVTANPDPPPPESTQAPPHFLARELLELLTPADLIAIDRLLNAREENGDLTAQAAAFTLLWGRLQAQAEAPIRATAGSFRAGWVGITLALGAERAAEIASALGIAEALAEAG